MSRPPWLLSLALFALLLTPHLLASSAQAQAACTFTLGFKDLHDQIPQIVGTCLEDEHPNPDNGNTEQRTSGGLLVYRQSDNWTAFTNGGSTWINGPYGLQSRANGTSFPWEAGGRLSTSPTAATAPDQSPDQLATLDASGWATVVQIVSPEALVVTNSAGQQFGVYHIGIIGPAENQGTWRAQATAEHARQLPVGSRVWLQAEDGIANPRDNVALRHVLRDGNPDKPVAADLLRAGSVWVFPDGRHRYVDLYGDRQAEAVLAGASSWGESGSTALFKPRGAAHGGYPINPLVQPALAALDASTIGHSVLLSVNAFPVEIGVSNTSGGSAAGYFAPRYYTIQLGTDVISAPPESTAAVLIHELTHAQQMIDKFVEGDEVGCVKGEIEAFGVAAQYWSELYGESGKQRPTHWLDRELNTTLRQYVGNQIEARVLQTYGHQCGNDT
jgi:hypothetical protein